MKRGVLLALFVGLTAALLGGPASAQVTFPYPPYSCQVGAVDVSVTVGGDNVSVHVCAVGQEPGLGVETPLTIALVGTPVRLTVPAGTASAVSLPIPSNLAAGTYMIETTGIGTDGKPFAFQTPIEVVAPNSPAAAAIRAAGGVAVAPAATAVKGTQLKATSTESTNLVAAARQPAPAGMKFAGLGLLSLLGLSAVGAVGYTAFARIRS